MGKLCHRATLATISMMWIGTAVYSAPPEPAAMLAPQFQPKQPGVNVSTPTGAEVAACKVELVNGPGTASGWLLKDSHGQPVRKFVASKGSKSPIDVWSFYLDGQEVYREIDTASSGKDKPDHYRWYGAGGMRWGVDVNRDGKIDGWMMISAEEVSQELLKAVASRDTARFSALVINDKEVATLELPAAEADKIKQAAAQAKAKFNTACAACANVNEKSIWMHLEVQSPQCTAADTLGGKLDLVRYKSASILYENSGKHDWLSLGEMIQVGRAWRLVSAPSAGNSGNDAASPDNSTVQLPAKAKELVDELQAVDKHAPKPGETGPEVAKYQMDRAKVLEKIAEAMPAKEQEQWLKQLADSYSAAAQNLPPTDKTPVDKLKAWREKLGKVSPNGPITGYFAYREISAEYTAQLQTAGPKVGDVQDAYREKLKGFVNAYPSAEDAPDAAMQVGMVSEFMGKETEAKNWYTKVKSEYASNPQAPKANGALRRLDSEGKAFELQGQTLNGKNFNFSETNGKVTIVYYWASWNNNCASDIGKLNNILKLFGDKGVELVTVNLDEKAEQAGAMVGGSKLPGTHLYGPGGLDSAHATQYGIMVLPQIFLVGKDGKVVNRACQINTLDDEVKKLTDK